MKKIKQLFRKGVALALAAVTTLSVLPAATVSAASQRATITFAYCYDGNGNTIRYQQTASHNGVTFSHAGEARTRIYADGDNAYCIEPGILPAYREHTREGRFCGVEQLRKTFCSGSIEHLLERRIDSGINFLAI